MRAWSFCPVCGHRIYQHMNDGGCTHTDPGGGCDCTVPHDLLNVQKA